MRELNECKAEVFRRSERRIKERRRVQKRIFTLCIPICLVVVLCSVMILPETVSKGNRGSGNKVDGGVLKENSAGSIVCSYTLVEIQWTEELSEHNTQHYMKVTDKVEVTKIFCAIHSLFSSVDDPEKNAEGSIYGNQQIGSTGKPEKYKVIFSTAEGYQTVYNLYDNKIFNVSTGEKMILTDEQTAQLKVTLGILK